MTLHRYTHVSVEMQQATAEAFARRLLDEGSDTTTSDADEADPEHLDARMGTGNP